MNLALAGLSYGITVVALVLLTVRTKKLIGIYKKGQPDPTRGNDKAQRLKKIPRVIATELGENLIPAIEVLHVEGIPQQDVDAFVVSLKSSVFKLLDDCDVVWAVKARSIRHEYSAIKNGTSGSEQICREALRIADAAMDFTKKYEVL